MARTIQSVTAAGRTLDLADERTRKEIDRRPLDWQRRSLDYYDPMSGRAIGEVWFAGRYIAEALSRLRVFPAIQPDPEADPISILSPQLDPDVRPSDQEIDLLLAAHRRLTNSHGGIQDILRGLALNLFLCGEGFLVGRTVDDREEWETHSVDALQTDGSGRTLGLKLRPDDRGDQLIPLDDATVIRIWRRHPRFGELPDASMGAALVYCEDLSLYTQMIRATGRSRMPSGIIGIPSEASEGPRDLSVDEGEGDPETDPLTDALIKHFSTPITNPNDAAAVVPFVLRLSGEDLAKVNKWEFSRDIDRLAVELRREAREAFATTVDLPSDVISGRGGVNHWNIWYIGEETFRVHLAPPAELMLAGLTDGYLRPTIQTGVADASKYLYWYDASELVSHPNQAENAKTGHAAYVISDSTLRAALNFDEADAPDEDEITRRIEIARAVREPNPGFPTAGPDTVTEGPPDSSVTASAQPDRVSLGYRLALLERSLLERLLAAADSELRRALDRAGNRVIASARRRAAGEATRRIVADSPNPTQVLHRLGESVVAALGLTNDQLVDGAFEQLHDRWETWVARAQSAAVAMIVEEGEAIDEEDEQALNTRMGEDREAGWLVLQGALVGAATGLLFQAWEPSSLGEHDPSLLLSPGVFREALTVSGGGPLSDRPGSGASSGAGHGGLFSGETVTDLFRAAAVEELGWVWVYGDPSTRQLPFEAHLDLDGQPFTRWEDPILANPDPAFPETDFLYPSDHPGCQCVFARDGSGTVPEDVETSEE